LKIVKHCQEEAAGGTDLVQGVLLGLVVDNKLEITNCFPFPRHNDEEEFNEGTVKPAHKVTSIKQSPVLIGHLSLVLHRTFHMN